MCGFRRLSEIAVHLRKHPEFAACISTEAQLGVFMASSLDVGGQKRALHGLFERRDGLGCTPQLQQSLA